LNNSVGDYISDNEKENYSEESNGGLENEMKRKLFENLKKAGVLDGMKSTLRVRLYEQLRLKAEKPRDKGANQLAFKIATSLVADLMQKCDMPYALSVFLPESGLQGEAPLSKPELLDLLNLKKDENYTAPQSEFTPLLTDLVQVLLTQKSIRPNKVSSFV
jgi:LisH